MLQQLASYVKGVNKESTDFSMMLYESGGTPFAVSIRYKKSAYEEYLFSQDSWGNMALNVEAWSDGTMFVRSTPKEFNNGILDISISPKTTGFREEKAIKTLTKVLNSFKKANTGSQ